MGALGFSAAKAYTRGMSMRTKDLAKFIIAREKVRVAKEAGKPRPWTKDEILNTYRFCNVHREDDKVTRWIAENWREPFADNKDLWFAMVVARLFNLPRTLDRLTELSKGPTLKYVVPFNPQAMSQRLKIMREHGPIFNGAYIVSTNGVRMDKVNYLMLHVLGPLWANRKKLRPKEGDTLGDYHTKLMNFDGMGSFMAAQVVADLKYVEPLRSAMDWHTWAASGPGSRRGLNRVCEHDVDEPWRPAQWYQTLMQLRAQLLPLLNNMELHAQDLQNCLCEFDKYERVRLGEGRPKQLYRAH